jgi:hypothetical protein
VSPPTRARVLAAIEQLGYRPAENARSLARGHRDALGVVVPGVTLLSAAGCAEFSGHGDDPSRSWRSTWPATSSATGSSGGCE